jgi:hypothetical protein
MKWWKNLVEFLERNIAEGNRIVVTGEPEVSALAVFTRVRFIRHEVGYFAEVGI